MDQTIVRSYKDLEVYRRSYELSLELHKLSLNYPKLEQFNGVADQLRRCSKGICANIAEGFGKQRATDNEFKRFLTIAIGSSDEVKVWLQYSFDLGYIDKDAYRYFHDEYVVVSKMLNGLSRKWR